MEIKTAGGKEDEGELRKDSSEGISKRQKTLEELEWPLGSVQVEVDEIRR